MIPSDSPWNWWQGGVSPSAFPKSAIVEACISAYARTVAMCPGAHWRESQGGGRERVMNSALSRILQRPNAYQTNSDFILSAVRDLYGDGNAYALALRNDRFEIDELHLMRAFCAGRWSRRRGTCSTRSPATRWSPRCSAGTISLFRNATSSTSGSRRRRRAAVPAGRRIPAGLGGARHGDQRRHLPANFDIRVEPGAAERGPQHRSHARPRPGGGPEAAVERPVARHESGEIRS